MYHINYEGKVYPCRAKVRSCPYGSEWHANSKEELFYKHMRFSPEIKVVNSIKNEIAATGRLRSLYSLSQTLEEVPYPMESMVANLEYAINEIEETDPDDLKENWENFASEAAEMYATALEYRLEASYHVPEEIKRRGAQLFNKRTKGKYRENEAITGGTVGVQYIRRLNSMKDSFAMYEEYKQFGLTNENKANTLGWLKEDFYQFSHDLNTSKMLTRPIFYGDIEEGKKKIKEMDNYELLGAYDDYLVSDEEIKENIRLANNFDFRPRPDLSRNANINIRKWYDRNKAIVNDWEENTPKRVLLSMEMAKELDRRGLYRQ